jgi:aldose 1-epimerase
MSSSSAFKFLPTGALIQEFKVGGQNIVLGFPKAEPYKDAPFFGETIGRVANRIKNSTIESLNGKSYNLFANNGPHSLHGGKVGWGKKAFKGPEPISKDGKESVKFTYVSPDGEEGYPGTVELRVVYTAYEDQEDGVQKTFLVTEYEVELVGDDADETVVNVTNHR